MFLWICIALVVSPLIYTMFYIVKNRGIGSVFTGLIPSNKLTLKKPSIKIKDGGKKDRKINSRRKFSKN